MGVCQSVSQSAMKWVIFSTILAVLLAAQTKASHARADTAADFSQEASGQDEINAVADRYLAIMENMVEKINRGFIGTTAETPGFITKFITDLTTLLGWFLKKLVVGDPFATPGPPATR